MQLEIHLLVWSVALAFVQVVIAVAGAQLQVGLPTLAGNRENMPVITGWAGRADRAHRNMTANLLLFAILVLVAQITNRVDTTTALGAELFFWGRVAYAVIYLLGIPWLRTLAWAVSVVGMVMIFIRVV
jgi:uncharacterized MAPEG superfamily protein